MLRICELTGFWMLGSRNHVPFSFSVPSLHNILAGIFFHTKTEGKFYFTHFNVPESTFLGSLGRIIKSGAIPNRDQPADILTRNHGALPQRRGRTGSSQGHCSPAADKGEGIPGLS